MKQYFGPLLAFTLFSASAASVLAAEECPAGEAKAAFSKNLKGLKNYKFNKTKDLIKEEFQMADGTKVQSTLGGCAHFGRSLTFTIPKEKNQPKNFDSKYWLDRANTLLSKLPKPNDISSGIHSELNEADKKLLSQVPIADGKRYVLEAADSGGYDTASLVVTDQGSTMQIEVSVITAL